MRNKKKNKHLLLLLVLLLAISVGYALLSTTLKINGTSTITKNTWSVYWDAVGDVNKTDTVTVTTPAAVDANDNKQVNFSVALNLPGDYYEFQVDAVNNGTIDAMLESIQTKINGTLITATPSPLPSYVSYSITYVDGGEPVTGHLLAKKTNNVATRERYKVRIEFLSSVNPADLPSDDEPYVVDVTVDYEQADDTAVDPHSYPTIDSCPDCTFAWYTPPEGIHYYRADNPSGQPVSTLTDGTKDYTQLVDDQGNQRKMFFGHLLDSNGVITKAYVCGIKGDIPFCIQAGGPTEYLANLALIDGSTLWNGACDKHVSTYADPSSIANGENAGCYGDSSMIVVTASNGNNVITGGGHQCTINYDNGYMYCQ